MSPGPEDLLDIPELFDELRFTLLVFPTDLLAESWFASSELFDLLTGLFPLPDAKCVTPGLLLLL